VDGNKRSCIFILKLQDKGKPKNYEIPIITIKTLTNYMPIIQLPQDQERDLNRMSSSRFDLPNLSAMETAEFQNANLFDPFVFNNQFFIKGLQWAFSVSQLRQSGITINLDTLNNQVPHVDFDLQQLLLSWSVAEKERWSAKNELKEINDAFASKESEYQNQITELKKSLILEQNKKVRLTTGQNSHLNLKSMKVILPVTITTLELASYQLDRPKLSPFYWVKRAARKVFHLNSSGSSSLTTVEKQLPVQKKPLFDISTAPSYVGIQSVAASPPPPPPTFHLGAYIWVSI